MNFLNKKAIISLLVVGMFVGGLGVSNLRAETVAQCIAKAQVDLEVCQQNANAFATAASVVCIATMFWNPLLAVGCQATVVLNQIRDFVVCDNIYNGQVRKCKIE